MGWSLLVIGLLRAPAVPIKLKCKNQYISFAKNISATRFDKCNFLLTNHIILRFILNFGIMYSPSEV